MCRAVQGLVVWHSCQDPVLGHVRLMRPCTDTHTHTHTKCRQALNTPMSSCQDAERHNIGLAIGRKVNARASRTVQNNKTKYSVADGVFVCVCVREREQLTCANSCMARRFRPVLYPHMCLGPHSERVYVTLCDPALTHVSLCLACRPGHCPYQPHPH